MVTRCCASQHSMDNGNEMLLWMTVMILFFSKLGFGDSNDPLLQAWVQKLLLHFITYSYHYSTLNIYSYTVVCDSSQSDQSFFSVTLAYILSLLSVWKGVKLRSHYKKQHNQMD